MKKIYTRYSILRPLLLPAVAISKTKQFLWKGFVLGMLFCFMAKVGTGQIAAWDFTGENSVATSIAEIYNPGLDASNLITRGAAATASAGANSFRTRGFQNDGINTANTDYFEITLSAIAGNTLSLSSIDANFGGANAFYTSPGVESQFAYSLDGTTFTLIGSAVQSTLLAMAQINLSGIPALQNVAAATTITLRYYASGQTVNGGWGFRSAATPGTNGLAIGGTVDAVGKTTNQPGVWSDPLIWTPNGVPATTDNVTINHAVTTSSVITRDAGTRTLVSAGNSLAVGSGYTNNGASTINGTFQINTNGFADGTTDFNYAATGSYLVFNTGALFDYVAGQRFWPTTNGPENVTVNTSSSVNLNNGAKTINGTLSLFGGFTNNSGITINGILLINQNGFVGTQSPVYGINASLNYNTNSNPYLNGLEWTSTANPANVQLSGNTVLNYPAIGLGARTITGSLIIDAGSAVYMDYGSPNPGVGLLTVGDIVLNGSLSLGNQIGGDLAVTGNWTKGAGTFTPNARLVTFNGTSAQTLTGATDFAFLKINNNSGITLAGAASSVTIANEIDFTLGTITLGNNNFTVNSGANIANPKATSYVITNSSGRFIKNQLGNTATLLPIGTALTYTALTITNTGTINDISVSVNNAVTNPVSTTRIVNLEWSVLSGGPGAIVDIIYFWNLADQDPSFTQSASEVSNFQSAYTLVATGTPAGGGSFNISATGLAIPTAGTNLYIISNVAPTLTPSPASLSGLTYIFGSGPSTAASFTISARNLTSGGGNLTISESTDFEVSTTNATTGFGTSATLTYAGSGTLAVNTVWVRLKAGRSVAAYGPQSLDISGGGATTAISVSGNVTRDGTCIPIWGENFDYGCLDNANLVSISGGNWSTFSGANDFAYNAGSGISYPGYASSGVGGAAEFTTGASGDIKREFSATGISTGSVYASFLINMNSATSTSDDFFVSLIGDNSDTYHGRIFIRKTGTQFVLGIGKQSSSVSDAASGLLNFGTTYLIVVKYEFKNQAGNTDPFSLWVISGAVPSSEAMAGSSTISALTSGTDAPNLKAFALRQTNKAKGLVDGIRVGTIWEDAVCVVAIAPATTYTWTGLTNSSWGIPCNWTPNGVPGPADNVIFDTAPTNLLNLIEGRTVKDFTLNGTGNLTIGSTGILTITGNVSYGGTATASLNCLSTINILSAAAQTIPPLNYGNLNIIGGNRTLSNVGTIGICGALNVDPSLYTYTVTGSTVNYSSALTGWVLTPFTYDNLTFSGTGDFSIGYSSTNANKTINVLGNYTQTGGTVYIGDNATATATLNIDGDISLSAGIIDVNKLSGGTGIINLKGDLIVSAAANLFATNGTTANVNFSGIGDGLTAATTQTINVANMSTNQKVAFNVNTGAYAQLINQDMALGTSSNFTVKTGAVFDFGFNGATALNVVRVSGQISQSFDLQTGGYLKITSPEGITTGGNYTGNVQVGSGAASRLFADVATYHFIGKANQSSGNGLPGTTSAKKVIVELLSDAITLQPNGVKKLDAGGVLEIRKGILLDNATGSFTDGDLPGESGKLTMTGGRYQLYKTGTNPGLSGTYALSAGVVDFQNSQTTAQTIRPKSYQNIEVTGTSVANSAGNIDLNNLGTFTIKNGGIYTSSSGSASIVGAMGNQTLTVENNALFKCAVDSGFYGPANGFGINSASVRNNIETINLNLGSTVAYARETGVLPGTAANGQQVISIPYSNLLPIAYQNLTISGDGNKTAPAGTLTVQGDLVKNGSPLFIANDGLVLLNGAAQNFAGLNYSRLQIEGGTKTTVGLSRIDSLLQIDEMGMLNISDADTITIGSTASRTARVAQVDGNISYNTSGSFRVERYFNNYGRKWRYISIPTTSSTQTFKSSWQEAAVGNVDPKPGYGFIIGDQVPPSLANGYDIPTLNGPVVKTYDMATNTYIGLPAATGTNTTVSALEMARGNLLGYMSFVAGDRTVDTYTEMGATTLRTSGRLLVGNQTVTIPGNATTRFRGIGNPYASPINMVALINPAFPVENSANNIVDGYFVYDPKIGQLGAFQTLDWDGTGFVAVPGGGSYTAPYHNNLESGQGFFIQTNSTADAILNFTESMKTPAATQVNFTGGGAQHVRINLKGLETGGSFALRDGVLARFDSAFSNSVDGADMKKMANLNEEVALKNAASRLSVERRFAIKNNDTLQLELLRMKAQNYQWEINSDNLDYPGRKGFLIDRYTNSSTALDLAATTTYNFSVENVAGSYAADRFVIAFQQPELGPLPVNIVSVSATRKEDRTIAVNWKVENEVNLANYEIERSSDGVNFSNINTRAPLTNNGGSSSYDHTDLTPLTGDNFYRIKANSLSTQVQYSAIVKVSAIKEKASISIYPNPVEGRAVQVRFVNQPAGKYQVQITNASGQVIYRSTVTVSSAVQTQQLSLRAKTAAGNYQLKVVAADGSSTAQQLLLK